MRRGTLDSASRRGDECLDRGRVKSPREFLRLRLETRNDRHGHEVLVHPAVQVQDLAHFDVCFGFRRECGVTLLPKELAGTNEGSGGFELPTNL